ncbi:MAG: radical SAM family heme chaperone HemW [Alphaproteobacteria bacterium]|nr:radical SAM family heme chaperone HemW [Alphaproteobacteria bacterium]
MSGYNTRTMMNAHNIYIHVPFCLSKCNYCAFFSQACAAPDWETYTRGILAEIDVWSTTLGKISVPTIFFGGGTPSLMPTKYFAQIIERLHEQFDVLPNAEITLESNPGTLDGARLTEFITNGVNRLSIGVQSLNDDELSFMGRRHDVRTALKLLETAQNAGIQVSADFIYGLPGHTSKTVEQLCRDINKLNLTHCSMYELTIEPTTPFGKMNLNMPTNDEMAEMYTTISNTLDLPRYEVSNYAAPGFECTHNQNVWDGDPYIGLGRGAAGRVFMNDTWYEQLGNNEKFEPMSTKSRAVERVITGLRTARGVLLAKDILNVLNKEYINEHPELVITCGDRLVATDRGILVLDDLLVNIIN